MRQDRWGRTSGSDQSGQVSLDRTERTDQDMTATTGQKHQESCGQSCWAGGVGPGKPGQDNRVRTTLAGQLDNTDWSGPTGQDI
jgi:hypothetical protein